MESQEKTCYPIITGLVITRNLQSTPYGIFYKLLLRLWVFSGSFTFYDNAHHNEKVKSNGDTNFSKHSILQTSGGRDILHLL